MAYIRYKILWEGYFDNIVYEKHKVKDLEINQLKLEVQGTYKKDERKTIFEAVVDEDVITKAYLGETISEIDGHISILEKDYNEFELHYKNNL